MRNLAYAVMFAALGWSEPHGAAALALIVLMAGELVITLWDFVEEDRTRKLPATERVLHALLTLNYGVILAALYLLWAYQRVFHGPVTEGNESFRELRWTEGLVIAPLLFLIVFLGLYPAPMLERIARVWAEGRYDELDRYKEWCECLDTEAERAMHRRLLDERNPALAERIDDMHRAGKAVFAGVGSLHMIGPAGLPALLGQRGFQVERVPLR